MNTVLKNRNRSNGGFFKILKKDKKTRARLGVLSTPHGKVLTPSYVFVGTYGRFLHLKPRDLKRTGSQLFIANTFHLWREVLKTRNYKLETRNYGSFILNKFGMKLPTMTDSGGFQVLSLAFGDPVVDSRVASPNKKIGHHYRASKFMSDNAKLDENYKRKNIRITQKGVHFNFKGKKSFLGPELSMKLQSKIGADIIFAFDQITSPLDDYEYNRKAVELTDKWAKICLKTRNPKQMLFGIVQGGLFKDLRIKSAKSIGAMPFDGFGIGGSYTKKQISEILKWIVPCLPEERPRHLLGVGKVADVFEAVQNGIDTFDCVIPTREARHGRLYTKTGHMDIRKGIYLKDKKVIERGCKCPTCSSGITRSQIYKTFKAGQPRNTTSTLASQGRRHVDVDIRGQRWCLMHNMWFFNNLLEEIRESIRKGRFKKFKNNFLKKFSS